MSEQTPEDIKIYCPSLWKSVHVDVDGYLTPCCMFIHGEDKKTRIEDIPEGDTIETVLLDEFQEYRDLLTEGKWPRGCNQCEFAEKEGRASKRVQDLRVRVLNVVGEEIVKEELQQYIGEYTKQINLEDNAKGIYFLEIETNDGIINKKLVLQ